MPEKKIRIYELARELGLENKLVVELCKSLGIDVKTHSSSIENAQGDRVRRKAKKDNLLPADSQTNQAVSDSEKESVKSKNLSTRKEAKVGSKASASRADKVTASPETKGVEILLTNEKTEHHTKTIISSGENKPGAATKIVSAIPARPGGIKTSSEPEIEQGKKNGDTSPANEPNVGSQTMPPPPRQSPRIPRFLVSSTGKPIPPPPRKANSPVEKRIPPPPRARSGSPSATGANRSGLAGKRDTAYRPENIITRFPGRGNAAPFPPRTTQAPFPGKPGRQGQRRSSSRRRSKVEELEPTQLTSTYVPSNAPVPTHEVIIERGSSAQEVAPKLNRTAADMVRFLLLHGEMVNATQSLTDDMIELFAAELGAKIKLVDAGQERESEILSKYFTIDETEFELKERPPVVTVMGHVDHGKTRLLDYIRRSNVISSESGGITQHIGAYEIRWSDQRITFIDTPGHEAFTQMRARGAKVTDVVVLVVAADDGVMPQTIEAISHAKAAGAPIIVAINKIDLPDADPGKVMQQLSEYDLVPEQWGGDTVYAEVSAATGQGVTDLLDNILLVAELLENKTRFDGPARGIVLEAKLDVGRGPVATVIIQAGTLNIGDFIVAGASWGRVKAIIDDLGASQKIAVPCMPVQILGLDGPPDAGDEFLVCKESAGAKALADLREQRRRILGHISSAPIQPGSQLEDLFEQLKSGEVTTLNVVLKTDVQGSLEAVADSLRKLERENLKVSFVHRGVGGITETDVQLAIASNATIIGFNVRPDRRAREMAEFHNVDIRCYEIIYQLIEDVEKALLGMLKPEYVEHVTGEAEVRQVFRVPRVGAVAGCIVKHGVITRNSKVRFLRDGVILWKGTINSLKRFKEDVREVQEGFECGIGLSNFQDLKEGDIIETYEEREVEKVQ